MTSSSTLIDVVMSILLSIQSSRICFLLNAVCKLCRHSPQTCVRLGIHHCITRRSLIYKPKLQHIFPCTSSIHVGTGHLTCQVIIFMLQYWTFSLGSAQIS